MVDCTHCDCAGCYDRMSGRRGLDINKALLTSLDVKSSESKASIRFEVVPSDKALSTEDKEAIDLINSLSLNMDHAIVQDSKTVSIQGDIQYSGKKIPLHVSMDSKGMAIQLEGASDRSIYRWIRPFPDCLIPVNTNRRFKMS